MEEKDGTKIDIFNHLKINLKNNFNLNCKDSNTESMYCIPCKVSCCEKCTLDTHKNHILIDKHKYDLNEENIDNIFDKIKNKLTNEKIFKDINIKKELLFNEINDLTEILKNKIEKLKKIKISETNKIIDDFNLSVKNTLNKIEKCRNDMKNYLNKNNKFFNLTPTEDDNNIYLNYTDYNKTFSINNTINTNKSLSSRNSQKQTKRKSIKKNPFKKINHDDYNSIFLINYELFNLSERIGKEILNNYQNIENNINSIIEKEKDINDNLITQIDNFLFTDYNLLNYTSNNEDDENIKKIINENSPLYPYNLNINNINNITFSDVNLRIHKYNTLFDNMKKNLFDSVIKYGDLKEAENYITKYNNKNSNTYETNPNKPLFHKSKSINENILNKNNMISKFEIDYLKMLYKTKDDVILNNDTINQYFSYLIMNIYEKHFKQNTKILQSSHADLIIKNDENEEEKKDFGKAIENSNVIMLYYRNKNQMIKININLTKNPFGYKKFPIGNRSLLIGNKLYISGGCDEFKYYKNVIVYDIKNKKLKRIMDFNEARAYHTIVYSEFFKTIMVFGGENSNTAEIYDPILNRWIFLPSLNCPRANIIFQFDKIRGIIYTLFGNIGLITDSNYSNVIEYLDLKNIKKGWTKLEYKNNISLDLRTYLNATEINNDYTLIYGALNYRENNRVVCVLNKEKKEIINFDKKMYEIIREETKNSIRLSSLIRTLTVDNL